MQAVYFASAITEQTLIRLSPDELFAADKRNEDHLCRSRVTETARISDIHLQLKGGSNLALVNAMANVIWK